MKHDHRSRNERGRKRVLGHCRPWFGVIQVYHEQNFFFVLKLVQLESYHDPKMLTNRERKSINVRQLTDEGERERKFKKSNVIGNPFNFIQLTRYARVFQTFHQNYYWVAIMCQISRMKYKNLCNKHKNLLCKSYNNNQKRILKLLGFKLKLLYLQIQKSSRIKKKD